MQKIVILQTSSPQFSQNSQLPKSSQFSQNSQKN